MKKYKVMGPIGSMLAKETMTEKELREFIPTLIQDADQSEIWIEKAEKDEIDELVVWLQQAGYEVTEIQ